MKTFQEFLSIAEQQVVGPTRQVPRMPSGKPVVPVNIQPDRTQRRKDAYDRVTTTEAALALPLAAPIGKLALPVLAGGIKLAGDLMKADTAKPRTPNVQRGRLSSNDAYNRQKKEERKAEAQRRAREKAEQGIDSLIGSDAERKAAAEARANQPQIQRRLRQQAMRERMRKAAEQQGLD